MTKLSTVLFISLFLFNFLSLRSQTYVTIPDTAFVSFLKKAYPGCMNGKQLDITCSKVISDTILNCEGRHIDSIDGIQYFTNLKALYCWSNKIKNIKLFPPKLEILNCAGNRLDSLLPLPGTLKELDCTFNNIKNLPPLPESLRNLQCGRNQLDSLPSLPKGLKRFNCQGNLFKTLSTLPPILEELDCSNNKLLKLPALPDSIIVIRCNNNELQTLPALPYNLQDLYCSNNHLGSLPQLNEPLTIIFCEFNLLTTLPSLPPSLSLMMCGYNKLKGLPALPNSMGFISCDYNLIEELPSLPAKMESVGCSHNKLTSLPFLPEGLIGLEANFNNIRCFPRFPSSLKEPNYFDISGNPFTCLPNRVEAMNDMQKIMPICLKNDPVNNPNGCTEYSAVEDLKNNETILIYPNPGHGIYIIDISGINSGGEVTIEVFNSLGMPVLNERPKDSLLQIDLTFQPSGIYIVKINCNNQVFSKSVIKL